MDSTSHRPWETTSPNSQPHPQTLPSIKTLTNDVDKIGGDKAPLSSAPRDSGSWSGAAGSNPRDSMPYLNQSTNPSPSGPYTPDGTNPPSIFSSAGHSAHPSNASGIDNRISGSDFDDSRRGSVDSRIQERMKTMDLGPTSPYNGSANASQSSLVQGLKQQRGIGANGYRGSRFSGGSGPISPVWPRGSERDQRGITAGRVAPPIRENPRSEVYLGDAPVRGQAYAFPDPDARPARPPSNFSRRNSFAESFTSSILSDRSRLPPGQQELPGDTHHHSLQHRQVESLRGDPESPNSATPYSRTPELRVTHKLAERKRRSEMKDCFEQLRAKLPANQNNKSSKWETLARAIEYIQSLESTVKQQRVDGEQQRHQIQKLEMQMKELSQQMQRMQHGNSYQPPPNNMPQSPIGYAQPYSNGVENSNEGGRTLPPIMNGAMQGVQYGDDRR